RHTGEGGGESPLASSAAPARARRRAGRGGGEGTVNVRVSQGACQAGESRCTVSRELPVQVVVAVALPCEHGLGLLVGCRARIRLWSLRSWHSARRDCSKYPGAQSPRVHWRSENGATRAGTIDLFDLRIARP